MMHPALATTVDDVAVPAARLAPWMVDIQRAAAINARDRSVFGADPQEAAARVGALRYVFLGQAHHIAPVATCEARGYAACADVVAAVLAASLGRRDLSVLLCIEAPDDVEGYSHVRCVLERRGFPPISVDPFARYRARVAPSCEWVVPASEVITIVDGIAGVAPIATPPVILRRARGRR